MQLGFPNFKSRNTSKNGNSIFELKRFGQNFLLGRTSFSATLLLGVYCIIIAVAGSSATQGAGDVGQKQTYFNQLCDQIMKWNQDTPGVHAGDVTMRNAGQGTMATLWAAQMLWPHCGTNGTLALRAPQKN